MEGVGVGAGVDLADLGADARGGFDLRQFGVDEHAGHDAGIGEAGDHFAQSRFLAGTSSPPSVVTSWRPSGTSMAISGLSAQAMADHLVGRGHFQVELDVRQFRAGGARRILDVAAVFAQMHGDAVGAAEMGFHGGPHRVRLPGAARLAQRGDVVDVDTEFDHCLRFRLVTVPAIP
jgi:hypothetical protein